MNSIKKVLIDITHPAHLHFFRNVINILKSNNIEVMLTGRDKDILKKLAIQYDIKINIFGKAKKGVINLILELIYRMFKLNKIINNFKPHVILSIAGTYTSFLGKLKNIPVYIFYDTEHAFISNLIAYPFATCIYVPRCYRKKIKWNHERYNGYHELAYLHSKYFSPDINILKKCNLKENEKFTIIRYVGWGAVHDIGLKGFSLENKILSVKKFREFGQIFISSEDPLPESLEPYRLKLDIKDIHHLMYYASLVFGESATMASEAAVLGTPSVYVDPVGRGYTDEEEKDYEIVFNYTHKDQNKAIKKGYEILQNYDKQYWKSKRKKILEEKIDVTDFIYNIIVNTIIKE